MRLAPRLSEPFRPHASARPALGVHRASHLEIVEVALEPEQVTLQLCGELDALSAALLPAVVHRYHELSVESVRLDLSRLQFCDCAGLRAMLEAHNDLLRNRIPLVLTGLQPPVCRLFSITGLDEALRIDDAVCDALRQDVLDGAGPGLRSQRP